MSDEQFGPYRLVRLIGRGGMGEVFEAHDVEQDRLVAVKRLLPHMLNDEEFQKRFRRESRVAARLRSPHVIPIHRSGEIDGQLFIDMRLVDGFDLETLLGDETQLDPQRAVAVVEQVASAIDAAHHAGLIHRDIKPSNVLLDTAVGAREFVYLVDFGITRALGAESQSLTSTHSVIGSLDYMAPEQFDGVVRPEIDVYSLGCLLFQCLTGSKPFPVEGFPALMRAHLSKPVPLPSECRPDLGDAFDEVIAQALAKDPTERFATAGALAAAARGALGRGPATGGPAASPAARRTKALDATPLVESVTPVGAVAAGGPAPPSRSRPPEPPQHPADLPPVARASTASDAVGGDGATAIDPDRPGAGGTPVGLLGSAKAPTVSRPRVDHAPAVGPVVPEQATPWHDRREPPPRPPSGAPARSGGGSDASGDTAPRRRSRGMLIGAGALALVLVMVLGVVIGSALFGPGTARDPAATTAQSGPTAIPLPTPAPSLRSTGTPRVTATFSVGNAPEAIALSPDGQRAYVTGSGGGDVVNVIGTARGDLVASVPAPGPPQFIAADPQGRRAYVTLYDVTKDQNAVAVLDMRANTFTAVIPTGQKRPFGLAVSPDGVSVYVPNHDSGDVTVIDTAQQRVVAQIPVPASPHWIAFSPTGRFAYAANHHSGVVTVLDTKTNTVAGIIPIGDMVAPHSIAVMPDGRRAMVTNFEGNTVSTIDTATNRVTATVPVGKNPQSIAFARDGRHAYVVDNATNDLTVLDTDTGAVTATIPTGTSPWMVAVSPDGRSAYVTNKENNSVMVLAIAS